MQETITRSNKRKPLKGNEKPAESLLNKCVRLQNKTCLIEVGNFNKVYTLKTRAH